VQAWLAGLQFNPAISDADLELLATITTHDFTAVIDRIAQRIVGIAFDALEFTDGAGCGDFIFVIHG
jgi:hypothetical protein